jgi:hypothetical protein
MKADNTAETFKCLSRVLPLAQLLRFTSEIVVV